MKRRQHCWGAGVAWILGRGITEPMEMPDLNRKTQARFFTISFLLKICLKKPNVPLFYPLILVGNQKFLPCSFGFYPSDCSGLKRSGVRITLRFGFCPSSYRSLTPKFLTSSSYRGKRSNSLHLILTTFPSTDNTGLEMNYWQHTRVWWARRICHLPRNFTDWTRIFVSRRGAEALQADNNTASLQDYKMMSMRFHFD